MKKLIFVLGVISFTFLFAQVSEAQCNPQKYVDECIPKLQEGFNFLKSYTIDGQAGAKKKVEYSYVFTKGAQYQISICNGGDGTDGIVLTLYDSNRRKVGTSLINGNYLSGFVYPCNATGIYYITFTFENSKNYCGASVLGFKR